MGKKENVSSEKIHAIVDANFDEQLKVTQEVVRVKSILDESGDTKEHPFGHVLSDALDDFLRHAERLGFRTKNVDNYIGYAEMGDQGDLIGILVHLDVVPEGQESDWVLPPYGGVIKDSALHGRGTIDDKGPAVSVLYAMKALLDSGIELKKRFRLILGLDEESGSRCILHYKEYEDIPAFSFSPDAEFPVVNAEKGILRATISKSTEVDNTSNMPNLRKIAGGDRFNVVPDSATAEIVCTAFQADKVMTSLVSIQGIGAKRTPEGVCITATGISAHAMEPHKGDNAIQKLLGTLKNIQMQSSDASLIQVCSDLAGNGYDGRGLGIVTEDKISGFLTCNLAAIVLSDANEGKEISMKLDIRYPVTADSESLLEKIDSAVRDKRAQVTFNVHKKPLYIPETNQTVQILLDAYETIMGDRPAPISMGGGTYCRFMPNAVSAGPVFPGEAELAHQANECVLLENLKKSTHIYAEALVRFNEM